MTVAATAPDRAPERASPMPMHGGDDQGDRDGDERGDERRDLDVGEPERCFGDAGRSWPLGRSRSTANV